MIPGLCLFDSFKKALLCHIQKFLCFRTDLTNRMCPGRVRMISFVDQSCIQAHNVAFFQDTVSLRDTVNNLFVHRYTDGCWKTTVMQEIRLAAKFPDYFIALLIDLHGGDTRTNDLCHLIMYNFQPSASLTHQFDLFCIVVAVRFNSDKVARGEGRSKKVAEQHAAREALKLLGVIKEK